MPLALHDVADAEGFCAFIVARSRLELSYHDREDLHAWLVSECWLLSLRFEPGGISFSTYAGNTLKRRSIDWQRQRFGRRTWRFRDKVYERPRVTLVSLDDPGNDRLESALGGSGLDDCEHRLADELRALDQRGSRPSRRRDWLGEDAA
jgi:hypothetical protein